MNKKIKPCPRCGSDEVELVPLHVHGQLDKPCQAVECFNCGFRSQAAAQEDDLAVRFWNEERDLSGTEPHIPLLEDAVRNHQTPLEVFISRWEPVDSRVWKRHFREDLSAVVGGLKETQ